VKLYFPRELASEDALVGTLSGEVKGGEETVLVVEDDYEVREVAVSLLTELGYGVVTARDAASALVVVESGIPIDVIVTDVMMPGALRSPDLARKAKERLPNVAVLFRSGYTQNAIVHGGRLDAGVELLAKPYTREAIARKVRHVLANQAQRRVAQGSQYSTNERFSKMQPCCSSKTTTSSALRRRRCWSISDARLNGQLGSRGTEDPRRGARGHLTFGCRSPWSSRLQLTNDVYARRPDLPIVLA
jgi:CheY-like chemotaxis protein